MTLRAVLGLSAVLALASHTLPAYADDSKPATDSSLARPRARFDKARKKRPRAVAKPKPEKPSKREKKAAPERVAAAPDAVVAAQAAATSANAQIVKEGDTSVKVMSFEGLGIEGRVKSPQLVYFVQRVQAEFERPVLPHRSFMPELADSTAREPVR